MYGVVYPEESGDLFIRDDKPEDEAESTAILLRMLPLAVETLQAHGEMLKKEWQYKMAGGIMDMNRGGVKLGRNDACPCGSGKKYKKCCEMK